MNKKLLLSVVLLSASITLLAYLSHTYITSMLVAVICLFSISSIAILLLSNLLIKKTQQALADLAEQEQTHSKTELAQIGDNISNKASELAINSAEISFFLGQLSSAIEKSSEDVDRLATAAEQMSANSKQINDNAVLASEQASHAMTASTTSSAQLGDNIDIVNQLSQSVNNAADKIQSLEKKHKRFKVLPMLLMVFQLKPTYWRLMQPLKRHVQESKVVVLLLLRMKCALWLAKLPMLPHK